CEKACAPVERGRTTCVLGLARLRRGPRLLAPLRPDELRQGAARTERTRLTRRGAGAFPPRPGRSEIMSALEVARAALAATDGDAEAVAHTERSGLARFAASEVH